MQFALPLSLLLVQHVQLLGALFLGKSTARHLTFHKELQLRLRFAIQTFYILNKRNFAGVFVENKSSKGNRERERGELFLTLV